MNKHVDERFRSLLHNHFNLPIDEVDHFAREEAKRGRDRERRLMEHPDSRDPEYPEDDE